MDDTFEITGETAIVTGASRGIGRAIAERFAHNGVDLVLCSRSHDEVAEVADGIAEGVDAPRAIPVECDVGDWDAVEALVDTTVEEFGGVDVLVNNAGRSDPTPFEDLTREGWDEIVDTNLGGVFNCTRIAGDRMREGDGGAIVNVSAASTRWGLPEWSHYVASKVGIESLTRIVAAEWADEDVRVNAVAPGPILTERMAGYLGADPDAVDESEVDRVVGTPDEIARVVQVLASPAASFVQGETIYVKGPPRIPELDLHAEIGED
jgi:NAD(P)-dependent dehydrogenase (short-subunit alcohol dehydrogenase family)